MSRRASDREIIISAVTMNCFRDKKKNMEKYRDFIRQAAAEGGQLIVFPEMSLQGYVWEMLNQNTEEELRYHHENAEPIPGPSTEEIAEEAAKYNIHIIFGMTEKAEVGGGAVLYNASVMVGPKGPIGVYRKVHSPGNELHLFNKGNLWPVFKTELGTIGMLLCYDKFFPEATRELALQGAEILVSLSAWSKGGDVPEPAYYSSLDKLLDRIRAIENQCWLVSANQVDLEQKGGLEYYGHSRIVSPDGIVLAEGGYKEGLVMASVDIRGEMHRARTITFFGLNLIKDRMPATYRNIPDSSIYYPPVHMAAKTDHSKT
jgi:predicted amidohydrolase